MHILRKFQPPNYKGALYYAEKKAIRRFGLLAECTSVRPLTFRQRVYSDLSVRSLLQRSTLCLLPQRHQNRLLQRYRATILQASKNNISTKLSCINLWKNTSVKIIVEYIIKKNSGKEFLYTA